jgi:hypothetical protein
MGMRTFKFTRGRVRQAQRRHTTRLWTSSTFFLSPRSHGLEARLTTALQLNVNDWKVRAAAHERLTYASEVLRYDKEGRKEPHTCGFQTDLLVYDTNEQEDWIPRVAIECKQGITTHDALTYSTKAALHKQVHPYLRYGLLIGGYESSVPGRVIRHGAYFDFMMFWSSQDPTREKWAEFINLLREEIKTSRILQDLLTESRLRERKKFWLFHRTLRLKESQC